VSLSGWLRAVQIVSDVLVAAARLLGVKTEANPLSVLDPLVTITELA